MSLTMRRPFHSYTRPTFKAKGSHKVGSFTGLIVLGIIIFLGGLTIRYYWHAHYNQVIMKLIHDKQDV